MSNFMIRHRFFRNHPRLPIYRKCNLLFSPKVPQVGRRIIRSMINVYLKVKIPKPPISFPHLKFSVLGYVPYLIQFLMLSRTVHVPMLYVAFLLRYGPWKFQHFQKICCFYVIHAVAYNSTVHQARVMRFTAFDSQCSRPENALIPISTCSARAEL